MSRHLRPLHSSPPRPCPYLPGRTECVVATKLKDGADGAFYQSAIKAGFRRSHDLVYRPACPGCDACRSVRVLTEAFKESKSQDRVWRANHQLSAETADPMATTEQYGLFSRYQGERHRGGGMDRMSFIEYRAMMEESPVTTFATEFRDADGELVALMLADELPGALSAVYSFFEPARSKQALGTFMILWLISEARRRDLAHVYLGYWVSGCAKMDYKSRFRPLEVLGPNGWRLLETHHGSIIKETA